VQHGAQQHGVQQKMRAVSRCQLTYEDEHRLVLLMLQITCGGWTGTRSWYRDASATSPRPPLRFRPRSVIDGSAAAATPSATKTPRLRPSTTCRRSVVAGRCGSARPRPPSSSLPPSSSSTSPITRRGSRRLTCPTGGAVSTRDRWTTTRTRSSSCLLVHTWYNSRLISLNLFTAHSFY